MEYLWAPWRLAYVTGASGTISTDCIFCNPSGEDREQLTLVRGLVTYVVGTLAVIVVARVLR